MRQIAAALLVFWCAAALAAAPPYNESADARAEVQHAKQEARSRQVPLLIIFGANWCEDCRVLDRAFHRGRTAELMARSFRVVKVDVGQFDRNLDIAESYGNPIKRGIPAAVVLSDEGAILYATRAGELAKARRMGESGIYEFFSQVSKGVAGAR